MTTQIADVNVRAIFEKLAQQETKHKAYYSNMLAGIKTEQSPGVKENDEYRAYMGELITASRTTPALASDDFKNVGKVLDYAIAREKDSVLFYSSLKNFADPSVHEHIEVIIHEEEHHAAILMKVKEQYK